MFPLSLRPKNVLEPTHSSLSLEVLDLHEEGLNELPLPRRDGTQRIVYPWRIIFLQRNRLTMFDGLAECANLRRLDLSGNCLTVLPNRRFWTFVPNLEVLLLHDNKLEVLNQLLELENLPKLRVLTAYNNPVMYKQSYRHLLVNSISSLLLLDKYIVSDEELIENAVFPPKFARFGPGFQYNLREFSAMATPARHLASHREELASIRARQRNLSPVLTIQRVFRGFLVRRALTLFHLAASVIQRAVRRFLARRRRKAAWASRKEEKRQQLLGLNCLYVVNVNPLSASIFSQLISAVEHEHKQIVAVPETTRLHFLSSRFARADDIPLARRFPVKRSLPTDSALARLAIGSLASLPPADAIALRILKRRGCSLNYILKQRFLDTYLYRSGRSHFPQLLVFRAPNAAFLDSLIRSVHDYNDQTSLLPATNSSGEPRRPLLLVYPGPLIRAVSAAVTIQAAWRAFSERRLIRPWLVARLRMLRAVRLIQRWWRTTLFRVRMRLLGRACRTLLELYDSVAQEVPNMILPEPSPSSAPPTALNSRLASRKTPSVNSIRPSQISRVSTDAPEAAPRPPQPPLPAPFPTSFFLDARLVQLCVRSPNEFVNHAFLPEHQLAFGVETPLERLITPPPTEIKAKSIEEPALHSVAEENEGSRPSTSMANLISVTVTKIEHAPQSSPLAQHTQKHDTGLIFIRDAQPARYSKSEKLGPPLPQWLLDTPVSNAMHWRSSADVVHANSSDDVLRTLGLPRIVVCSEQSNMSDALLQLLLNAQLRVCNDRESIQATVRLADKRYVQQVIDQRRAAHQNSDKSTDSISAAIDPNEPEPLSAHTSPEKLWSLSDRMVDQHAEFIHMLEQTAKPSLVDSLLATIQQAPATTGSPSLFNVTFATADQARLCLLLIVCLTFDPRPSRQPTVSVFDMVMTAPQLRAFIANGYRSSSSMPSSAQLVERKADSLAARVTSILTDAFPALARLFPGADANAVAPVTFFRAGFNNLDLNSLRPPSTVQAEAAARAASAHRRATLSATSAATSEALRAATVLFFTPNRIGRLHITDAQVQRVVVEQARVLGLAGFRPPAIATDGASTAAAAQRAIALAKRDEARAQRFQANLLMWSRRRQMEDTEKQRHAQATEQAVLARAQREQARIDRQIELASKAEAATRVRESYEELKRLKKENDIEEAILRRERAERAELKHAETNAHREQDAARRAAADALERQAHMEALIIAQQAEEAEHQAARVRRVREAARTERARTDREISAAFMRQQNTIAKFAYGTNTKQIQTIEQTRQADDWQTKRATQLQRRMALETALFENFDKRRQSARAQSDHVRSALAERAIAQRAEHEARIEQQQQRRDVRALVAQARLFATPPELSAPLQSVRAALATPQPQREFLKRATVPILHSPATLRAVPTPVVPTLALPAPRLPAPPPAAAPKPAKRSTRKQFAVQLTPDEPLMSEAALAAQINALESLADRVRVELETSLAASIQSMRPGELVEPRPPSSSRPTTALSRLPSARPSNTLTPRAPESQSNLKDSSPTAPGLSVQGSAAAQVSRPGTARRVTAAK